jgi:hypothetical protein
MVDYPTNARYNKKCKNTCYSNNGKLNLYKVQLDKIQSEVYIMEWVTWINSGVGLVGIIIGIIGFKNINDAKKHYSCR